MGSQNVSGWVWKAPPLWPEEGGEERLGTRKYDTRFSVEDMPKSGAFLAHGACTTSEVLTAAHVDPRFSSSVPVGVPESLGWLGVKPQQPPRTFLSVTMGTMPAVGF